MTYLNHAGTSWPKPPAVRRAAAAAWESDTSDWSETFQLQHERVGRAFGLADPSRLLLTPGCTSALAVGIADLPWQPSDRILISALEHHAIARPAMALKSRGVQVGVVPRGASGPLNLDRLESELQAGGVRLVAMTAACNVTGELLPMAEVIALAHEYGALCLVDGAQLAGWVDVDLQSRGADLFAFAGHKGLQAPWGIGGLYVAPHVETASLAAACTLPVAGAAPACSTMPGYCDVGSVDRAALAGLCAGLDWLADPERTQRLGRARTRIESIAQALEKLPNVRLLGERAPEARLPTVAFAVSNRASSELGEAFARRGITVGAGFQCAPSAHESLGTARTGAVRLSAGPGTTEHDATRTIAAAEEILTHS